MTRFRTFLQAANLNARMQESLNPLKQLDEEAEIQATCILFMCIYSNSFTFSKIVEGTDRIRKFPEFYTKSLKSSIDSLVLVTRKLERKLNRNIREKMGYGALENIALMNDSIDEQLSERYEALRQAIYGVFDGEYGLQNSEELSWVFAMDTLITIACEVKNDAEHTQPFLKGKIGFLDLRSLYESSSRMCSEAARRTPEEVHINLGKQLTVISKKQNLRKALENADVFAKAFQEGYFTLK